MIPNAEYKEIVLKYTRNLLTAFFFSNELNERAQVLLEKGCLSNSEVIKLSYLLNGILADIMFLREKFGWALDDKTGLMAQ